MNNSQKTGKSRSERFRDAFAGNILKARFVIFAVFLAAVVYSILSVGKVKVNSDITTFLPETTETRQGITVMEDEFTSYGTASVMVCDISYEEASEFAEKLAAVGHVVSVGFDETTDHFKDNTALFTLDFDASGDDRNVIAAMKTVRNMAEAYETTYISTEIGVDYSAQIASEMGGVLLIAALVIVGVLLFTSRSYFEVVIFFFVFVIAAVLNMGTNFWCGTISSITNSTAIILQLALAIDYAIIMAHRYQDEVDRLGMEENGRIAMQSALSKGMLEVSSSSLTTISGLVALTFMQFGLGRDLGVVLAKGIICSLLTVIFLMPGLMMLFPKALWKTRHRKLVPDITRWGRFLAKSKGCFVILFLLLIPGAFYLSENAPFAFHNDSVTELVPSESRTAARVIANTFNDDTVVAVLVPSGDYESEGKILSEVSELPEVVKATGLAGITILDGVGLTDSENAAEFAETLGIPKEQAELLYKAYAAEHLKLSALFGNDTEYSVPLVDMFLYLFDKIDSGAVTLTEEQQELLGSSRALLERGASQLKGTKWNRLVLTVDLPAEGEESVQFVEKVRLIAEQYYKKGSVLVVGNITSARDLADSFESDSLLITLLTACFVFVILLITFRSVLGSAILVFVIQGSIWLNFACGNLMNTKPSFVTYMIVSAIQMGATIDYAIVTMNRYRALRSQNPYESKEERKRNSREAMIRAVNDAFPTVMTSGIIMSAAGLLIAFRVSDVYIGHIGLGVGRGAIISMILVMTVLPQLLVLFDTGIQKTVIGKRKNVRSGEESTGTDPKG